MSDTKPVPKNFGVLVFPGFQALDAFGPLDTLNLLSLSHQINLSIIAATLDPVSTQVTNHPVGKQVNSQFAQSVVPTHTFDNAPPLDVLLIPGGFGVRSETIGPAVDFIKKTYPSLQYVITVCTGSWLAARAGILDGKKATSNKRSWEGTKVLPGVEWIAHARWVVDGNIWTASGVSAGIDATLDFIEKVFNAEKAEDIANIIEYDRHKDPSWDPFADLYGL